ncbi:unnamed protein product [Fusarium venenatum]|uniref:Uncharacterized protein n=1 Tax=Fusarium venenatum TaxID=56646 RepID=A0A2L2SP00_9HYPO|nr:uncharacterized protein FVRRES_12135 [Fusarium venenatum]CEI39444.1 unnamed protein product [Fusarium venenatum]
MPNSSTSSGKRDMKNNTGCRAASSAGKTRPRKPFAFTPVPPTNIRIATLRATMASQNTVPKKKNSTNVISSFPSQPLPQHWVPPLRRIQ